MLAPQLLERAKVFHNFTLFYHILPAIHYALLYPKTVFFCPLGKRAVREKRNVFDELYDCVELSKGRNCRMWSVLTEVQ